MPLVYINGDITKVKCDAAVNAANNSLLGGGGVDGAIHRAAGPQLLEECRTLGGCDTGDAKVTLGYNMPCKYIIHTVGPIWHGGSYGEEELLTSCYRKCLQLALEKGCESVAFPLISAGVYGYPKEQALAVAVNTIKHFLDTHDMLVYIVLFGSGVLRLNDRLYNGLSRYITQHYIDPNMTGAAMAASQSSRTLGSTIGGLFTKKKASAKESASVNLRAAEPQVLDDAACAAVCDEAAESLDERLKYLDESFSQMLLRLIDERGMTDAECYKKANIDRKLFSKIRSDANYHPKKPTAVAFALALELDMPQARELIAKAGYSLTHSNKFDIIIEYFIQSGNYNVFEINEALFAFDQALIGA